MRKVVLAKTVKPSGQMYEFEASKRNVLNVKLIMEYPTMVDFKKLKKDDLVKIWKKPYNSFPVESNVQSDSWLTFSGIEGETAKFKFIYAQKSFSIKAENVALLLVYKESVKPGLNYL
jgi:hypothetical protein